MEVTEGGQVTSEAQIKTAKDGYGAEALPGIRIEHMVNDQDMVSLTG